MSWNYRIIHHPDGHYALHEVFYDNSGRPTAMTEEPVAFIADAEEGPRGVVEALRIALADAQGRTPLPAQSVIGHEGCP